MDFNDGLDSVKLADLLDVDLLKRLQDNFARTFGVSVCITDEGKSNVVKPMDPNGFLTIFKNGSKERINMQDVVVPIMVDGRQRGSIVAGPVFTRPIDDDSLRKAAGSFGSDQETFLSACRKVREMTSEQLMSASNLLNSVVSSIVSVGEYRYKIVNVANFINDKLSNISASMNELTATASDVKMNQDELNKGIQEVNEISGKINDFTSLIKDIAKQTRLLGLNASIEAARAGTVGAGFSVVAEEIGKLAGNSSDTVDKIQDITARITVAVNETVTKGEQTAGIVSDQTEAIDKSSRDLEELSRSANELYSLAK